MQDNITRLVGSMQANPGQAALRTMLSAIADRLSSQTLGSAGLAIIGAANVGAHAATAFNAVANGILRRVAASTAMTALVGTTAINTFNVYCFYINSAGTLTTSMGTAATTLAGVIFPTPTVGVAMIGFITVNPTAAGFIGGTTALDAANTNVIYVNTQGAFDATIVVG